MAKAKQTVKITTTNKKKTVTIKPKSASTGKKTKRCFNCGKFMGNK